MIDLQNRKLGIQVYEAILRIELFVSGLKIPKFRTSKLKNGFWECKIKIPGLPVINAIRPSEIDSINRCAANVLHTLDNLNEKGQFDSKIRKNNLEKKVQELFGEVNFPLNDNYYICTSIWHLDEDEDLNEKLRSFRKDTENEIRSYGGEPVKRATRIEEHYLVKKDFPSDC